MVAVLLPLLMVGHGIQIEYFVAPNGDTPCPAFPCHTLSHYLENTTQYFTSNTRISFMHGVHEINKSGAFFIKNVTNLTLTGFNVSSSHAAKIVCSQPAVLVFRNIVNLVLKHFTILYCGYPLLTFYKPPRPATSAAVLLWNITSLKLSDISVENSTGIGLAGVNILGNSSISHSRFMFNNYYTLASGSVNCSYGMGSCRGGNMCLFYEAAVPVSTNVLSIVSCEFSNGVDVLDKQYGRFSSGLSVSFSSALQYKLDVSIRNVLSTRNIALSGANFFFNLHGFIGHVSIINGTSSMANYLQSPDTLISPDPAGFVFYYTAFNPLGQILTTYKYTGGNLTLLRISDSKFYDNVGGGVLIALDQGYINVAYQVIITNCSFQRNKRQFGSGLMVVKFIVFSSTLELFIQDTNFTNNSNLPDRDEVLQKNLNVVALFTLKNVKFINCMFAMNQQTALQAFGSTLYFGGHVIFSGNNGTLGGAMILQGGSIFYLMPHTHIEITNNHAIRGGGIYVEDQVLVITFPCFFQLVNLQYPYSHNDAVVTLENNSADEAGSALYGGKIDSCYLYISNQSVHNSTVFTVIFKIIDISSSTSKVSSNPVAVHQCILENQPKVYPGQMFKLPVVVYGQRNGSVPGIVRAEFVDKSQGAHFASLQETQITGHFCTNLTYTIFSNGHFELIELSIDDIIQHYRIQTGIRLLITLLPCPAGFQLSSLTAQCECAPLLKDKGLLCNISGSVPMIQRTKSVWISIHPNGNDTLLHDNCPLDYCKPTSLWLQLNHPDEQCAYGHSGLICGRCKSNLSLALGTSQCLECTNTHLVLLLPFSLAGLMLVLYLIVCDVTVSKGTINGLIFYANIVRVNRAFFFITPKTSVLNVFQQVLVVFIAWLNLDLGIETCFFHGMDAYTRAWLQFAFPFYIWTIVGIIIYLSRRSTTIVKLVGSSAVSVLATLFLLSYAKLQRTVITAFSFTYLHNYHKDGTSLAVWLYDGNVPFLQGKQIALFLMALVVTVFFILPFTLLLLFAPCIQASNHFLFKWVKMKLFPLLDAYQAPYKDKFRYWTGLMLVVRSILLVGYGLNILGDPDINHLLTVTVLAILFCFTSITGAVYKNKVLNILNISFIVNLLILSGWSLYNRHTSNGDSSDGQIALVCTSTGIAFVTFICILFYHTYLYLKSSKLHQCFKKHKVKRGDRREREAVEGSMESAIDTPPQRPPTTTVIELREPLLTDN